ncbi:TonB-dependent siderophore receptor [Methylobacterium currus]|uniref:TonB-dependent siderophore receptor n=1 Tax=Methylobacterium currus TaxID=2051553 RepID=A0A2R4WW29_9HYPH|nr:TonB-dependent siderophore receptor [Methylobacterium currus]AWB25725.1 TonB-dependent siderophore receptor [Methylobacterium currus]
MHSLSRAELYAALLPTLLASTSVLAQTAGPDTIPLQQIDVAGAALSGRSVPNGGNSDGVTGYVASRTTTGSKTRTPVVEIPQSVSTITREQLDDRNVQTLVEALNYTPGITPNYGYGPWVDWFSVRGFDLVTLGTYRDGLRQGYGGGNFAIPRVEPYGAQSITVLRGPASGLYGLGSPGGIINVITKRPTAVPFGEIQFQAGNYDRYQGNFDIGGPVVGNEQFSYRLTGLFRDAKDWLPGGKDNRTYIAPAITWRPDADTSVTLLAEHMTVTSAANTSYFYDAPNRRLTNYFKGDPAYNTARTEQYRIGYEAEHRFSDFLAVRQNFRFYRILGDYGYTDLLSIDPVANTGQRTATRIVDTVNAIALDNQAETRFELGGVANTLLFGLDYNHYGYSNKIGFGPAPDLDLFALNYGRQYIAPVDTFAIRQKQRQHEIGLYAQEQAKWGGFVLTLNGRQSWVTSTVNNLVAGTKADQDNAALTGRVGLAYVFDSGLAPYVSYGTNFSPQLGTDAAGTPFKPTSGEQEEVGIKYKVPDLPVFMSAALFNIDQKNVLRPDPGNPLLFQTPTGQIRSRGIELEATASLAPGWNLTAAYTHLDVTIVKGIDDPALGITTGKKLSGIPDDTVAAFAKYTFQPGSAFAGLGIGAGVRYISSSFGDDQNTFRSRGDALVDGVIDYDLALFDRKYSGLRLQVNATNLFDTRRIVCQTGLCLYDARRQVIGSLVYRW